MTNRVAVVGSANMDLVVRLPRQVHPGETITGSSFSTGPGGKGLNQAVACARAGAPVTFIGSVGSDGFGARLRAALEDEGIDTSHLRVGPEPTGVASISVTDDGENSIVVIPGANGDTELPATDAAAIRTASHLLVQLERPAGLVAAAMRVARAAGVVTVLTPAPVREGLDELIALSDILIPNEQEAMRLSQTTTAEGAAAALSGLAGTVVVTLGARGALLARGGEVIAHVAPRPVAPVDTTGAGDTFAGALVAWLAAGGSLDAALAAATAAASISVTRAGAAASMPRRDEILEAIGATAG